MAAAAADAERRDSGGLVGGYLQD